VRLANVLRHCRPELGRGKMPRRVEVPALYDWPGTQVGSPVMRIATRFLLAVAEMARSDKVGSSTLNELISSSERPWYCQSLPASSASIALKSSVERPKRPNEPHSVSPRA